MKKFKLLQGQHIGPDPVRKVRDMDGTERPADRRYRTGDIIETDADLDVQFNGTPMPILDIRGEPERNADGTINTVLHPQFKKFERLQDTAPVAPPKAQVVDLSSMSLEKLKEFAEEQEIDGVKDAKSANDALKVIRTALGSK